MQELKLSQADRESLLARLDTMADFLETTFARLTPAEAVMPGTDGSFSPVEQCWHLADLERAGFGVRIERLLAEDDPVLPDFDGDRIARERNYKSLMLAEGMDAFRGARTENITTMRRISGPEWARVGTQTGVGRISLCDVAAMMAEHDRSHREEIAAWVRVFALGSSSG